MEELTKKLFNKIREKISEEHFSTWFEPLSIESIDFKENSISIIAPNNFFIEWLEENFKNIIEESISEIFKQKLNINYKIVKKEKIIQAVKPKKSKEEEKSFSKNLNSKYIFERYVVGQFNQFAHAASFAVAKNPGKSYNPLFIYSGVGLGKTHLLNAIGNYIIQNNPKSKILCLTSEDFTNDLVKSIREEKMSEFRNRYRTIDVLLIDDIQFIAGKQSTQEELFHTFNSIYDNNKQIVFTSDSSPKEISGLENRLRTRFEWGLIADIQTPDSETLVAIINKKAIELKININNEISFFLANNLPPNIRTIEGSLIRLAAMASFENTNINENFIKRVLKDIIRIKEKDITVEYIQKIVSEFFGVKILELKSRKKSKQIALARQVGMYLSRHMTKLSYPHIGEKFGKKDHSTVIHAEKQIKDKIEKDQEFNNKIQTIKNIINSTY